MKNRLLLLSLSFALVSVSGVRAEDPRPATADEPIPGAPAPRKPDHPETDLEKAMGRMNKPWRTVRAQARDGTLTATTADLVATMIKGAEDASKMTPAFEVDQPVGERAKFQADYEAEMRKLIDKLGQLEAVLKANDFPAAKKLIADVGDLRKSGHHDFRKPEQD